MKIERLVLKNFRGVREMNLEFDERLTVLAGVNGAGKSTVLDALAGLLSWAVARISDPSEKGNTLSFADITNDEHFSFVGMVVENDGFPYEWSLLRRRPGFEVECEEPVRGEVDFAAPIRKRITETNAECSIPLMVLYPVNRVVHRSSFRRPRISDRTLQAFEGALDGRADFWSFFEWFREQDDIANENRSGREWFIGNLSWIERSVDRLLDTLERCAGEAGHEIPIPDLSRETARWRGQLTAGKPAMFFRLLYSYLEEAALGFPDKSLHKILHELQYLCLQIQEPFDLPPGEDMESVFLEKTLSRFLQHSFQEFKDKEPSPFVPFIQELLSFTLELNLWWMSADGKMRLGDAVRGCFPTYMGKRADSQGAPLFLWHTIKNIVASESSRRLRVLNSGGRELGLVRKAIESFLPEYTNLRISRRPRPRMLVEKGRETFAIDQLSDGEKCLIAMVGDLARRLAIANPTLDNPLEGEGVVLIDEIDLHLHPTWQQMVVPRLVKTFPKAQFIITTHSPQVLSHVEDKSVFLLHQTDEGIINSRLTEAYGQSYERLLGDVFGVAARPPEILEELDHLFDLIQRNSVQQARAKLEELRRHIGTDHELVRAGFLLHRKEEAVQ